MTEEEKTKKEAQNTEKQQEEEQEEQEPSPEETITQLQEEVELYKNKLQRSRADFENFKKRSEQEKQSFVKYANEGLILKILEAYEDLERALQVKEDKDLREGVELIYKKLTKILKDEGVEPINTEHQKFDPYKHEALLTENNDNYENNEIIEDLQKGYTLNSKVIRYSKVKVCKK
ncbi:nucleotide exchange factor GrpE [Methanosphaera sp. Vir-13MRS]|jgi:molecular chaperone GrpE|uniref:nucleotide exchange factor GrpE n=1 Tax=Candidatus Methanosphaera massiliense TaxID=3017187 RepID=UPI00238074F1|nr:nucleotide exchange factor GrpE [Candidatus Methanosphaera massiliense]MDD6285925.1 nucleotide exchange factor GrpE [Methanobacteriaceae archaeon]MDE4077910.1 nucleotide exchange factor GrpE [Candidatus Methanosphaera massiliense]